MSTIINAGRAALVPKGTYSDAIQYIHLDIVSFNGSSYICKADSIGNPPTDATHWQLLASGGGGGGGTQDVVLYKEYNGNKYEATWNGNAWIYDPTTPITPSEGVLYVNVDTSEMLCYMGGVYEGVNPLTIDSTPTASSPNPVASGGVYTALQGKQDVPIEILQNYNTLFSALNGSTQENPVTLSGEALDQYNALVAAVLAKKEFTLLGVPGWADPEQYQTDGTIDFGTYAIGDKSTVGCVRIYRVEDGGGYKYWMSIESETFALLDSPNFSGTPTAPTANVLTSNTQIATTEFVRAAINNYASVFLEVVGGSQGGAHPEYYDLDHTWYELKTMVNNGNDKIYVSLQLENGTELKLPFNAIDTDDFLHFSTDVEEAGGRDVTHYDLLYGDDGFAILSATLLVQPLVEVSETTPTQTLAPNTFFKFIGLPTSLTLTLGTPIDGITNIYAFSFVAGAANPTISLPASVTIDGTPSIAQGDYVEFSIMNNVAIFKVVTI